MSARDTLLTGTRVMSAAFLLAFGGGASLAADTPGVADPIPNPSEGEVQERSIGPRTGDLDIISVYGRCRAYSSPTGQTLCGRKVCFIAKNLGPFSSSNFKVTVQLGGLDHTTGNYGPRRQFGTFGPLPVQATTGEQCKEFPDQDFLDPFQPIHFVVVELSSKLELLLNPNQANNTESKSINYQTCLTQPGNQC